MHYETQLGNFERVDFWIQNRRNNCLLFEVVLLLLGACSEGADIGIMNPPSFSESYELPTIYKINFRSFLFSKRTHKNRFRTKTLMIHYICRSIFPTNLGSLEVVVLFCRVMPRLTSSTPAISGVSWTLPKKPPGIFSDETGNLLGKGVG